MPDTAKALAYYDHPFFGKWPAVTRNPFGKGTLTYEGTYLSDALQEKVLAEVARPRRGRSRTAAAGGRARAQRRQQRGPAHALLPELFRRRRRASLMRTAHGKDLITGKTYAQATR